MDKHPIIQLAAIIDQRNLPNGSTQVLVEWQGLLVEETLSETLNELLKPYPSLHLEYKVFVHGGRNFMNLHDSGSTSTSMDSLQQDTKSQSNEEQQEDYRSMTKKRFNAQLVNRLPL